MLAIETRSYFDIRNCVGRGRVIETRDECANDSESLATWRLVLRVLLELSAAHGKDLLRGAASKGVSSAQSRVIL